MARKSKEETLAEIHAEALAEFSDIQAAVRDERKQCLQDRRFYSIAGAQWEGPLGEQFANKPKFEINKIHLSVIRIINEYRNNRVTVDFVPIDGSPNDQLADACDDLFRATERDSVAEEAYDNAFEEAVGGGFGAFRLRAEYEDEEDDENEQQCILIEPIYDADSSVFFDLNAKRQDKADAKRCFVLTAMSPSAYMEEYGDDPASWPKSIHQSEFDWATPDVVFVAEYYRVEETRETIVVFEGLDGSEKRIPQSELDEDEEQAETLRVTGWRPVREKRIKVRKVHKYEMSGGKILEDCGYIAGRCIPVIPVYGKRWFVDNVERCMGHVRLAKDTQRLMNMQRSKLGEMSAYSSIEKPIMTPEQIAGYQQMWADDNIKNYPYLLANPVTDANGTPTAIGPAAYTKVPNIPPAMAALLQITEQDMQDLLGNQQAGEEVQANMSGKAVELIQNRLDMQSFIYMSNFSKAVKRAGEVWLSMAKDLFVESGRKLKGIGPQEEIKQIEVMRKALGKDGGVVYENDFGKAAYGVSVEVGPTSSSRRAATVRALTGMAAITDDPETKQVLGAMAMMNMEGEGIADARAYFRKKLIGMGVVEPTEEEAQEMAEAAANARPDANTTYLEAAAREADAAAANKNADTVLKVGQAEKVQAETMRIISDIDAQDQQQALEVIDRFTAPSAPAPGAVPTVPGM